jgi:ABC-type oligopeptide transport system substrate-binding subunit
MYQIQPNVTFQPLGNKLVREALNYAIDRQRMCDTVLMGLVGFGGPAVAAELARI